MSAGEPRHPFATEGSVGQLQTHPYLRSPRTPHLLRMWDELRELETLPQLDRWLAQRFRSEKRFGQKDRRWYSDALFAAFRLGVWAYAAEIQGQNEEDADPWAAPPFLALCDPQREASAWWQMLRSLPGQRLFMWLDLRLHAAAVDQGRAEARLLADWLRRKPDLDLAPLLLWYGLPPYFRPYLERRQATWSQAALHLFLEQQSSRPPLWLRLNQPDKKMQVGEELRARGLTYRTDALAIEVRGDVNLLGLECYKNGAIEVQDRASQRIGEAIPLEKDFIVWDCCAGGGGKSVQIAARLQNSGVVYASDIRRYKLDDLKQRADRAQLRNIRCWDWDAKQVPQFDEKVKRHGGFDVVLIDAPCSSTGTWRRSPDAKLRLTTAGLRELVDIQDHLLRTASQAVRPGSYLVYASCSWLTLENEERIEAFLATHAGYRLIQQQTLGCPEEDADAMFVALMQRGAH